MELVLISRALKWNGEQHKKKAEDKELVKFQLIIYIIMADISLKDIASMSFKYKLLYPGV